MILKLKKLLLKQLFQKKLKKLKRLLQKKHLGWNIGAAASVGLLKGESFSGGLPTGGTVVITTPFGFKLGPFDYTVSLGFGGYSGQKMMMVQH